MGVGVGAGVGVGVGVGIGVGVGVGVGITLAARETCQYQDMILVVHATKSSKRLSTWEVQFRGPSPAIMTGPSANLEADVRLPKQ